MTPYNDKKYMNLEITNSNKFYNVNNNTTSNNNYWAWLVKTGTHHVANPKASAKFVAVV